MKWGWVAFLIGAVFASVARADMFPDASNAKLPDARTNLAIAPHVATNAALTAASTASYSAGVWRDDFAAGNGAPPLWYQPSNSACSLAAGNGDNGSQVKSADSKCWLAAFPANGLDVREFGASTGASGSVNTAAMNSALAALATVYANGGNVVFPAGTFTFTGRPTFALPNKPFSAGIVGAGSSATVLNWPAAGGGLVLNGQHVKNTVNLQHFALTTGTTNGGTGLALSNSAPAGNPADTPYSLITDVAIMGSDGPGGTNYWTTGVTAFNWSSFNVRDSLWAGSNTGTGAGLGNGYSLSGTTAAYLVVWNFAADLFLNGNTGLVIGDAVQGITVGTGNNFVQNVTAINVTSGCTAACDLLVVNGSTINPLGDGIIITGSLSEAFITNNNISAGAGFSGIRINQTGGNAAAFTIVDNHFIPVSGSSRGTGITVTANNPGSPSLITGNVFINLTQGVLLSSGAGFWTIGPNTFNMGLGSAQNVKDQTAANDTIYTNTQVIGGNSQITIAGGGSLALGPFGGNSTVSENLIDGYTPGPLLFKNMHCWSNAVPGAGQTITIVMRVNGATPSGAPTCVISGTGNTGVDTTHLLAVPANSSYGAFATSSATAATTAVQWGIQMIQAP